MRRLIRVFLAAFTLSIVGPSSIVSAASVFADPAFQQQWNAGEVITPNFWGPLALARDGLKEPYTDASGGQRLVQYFDKGRMELGANGTVTNGLLATEILTGDRQLGDSSFEHHDPPAIPIAGDASNTGPTYPMLENASAKSGYKYALGLDMLLLATGDLVPFDRIATNPDLRLAAYNDPTTYSPVNVFGVYRERVGLATIGYAIRTPVWVNVAVGGTKRDVLVQVFQRRVLTYTPSNPDAFQVEMGNIGQHYYQWRYGTGVAAAPSPAAATAASPAATAAPPASTALAVTFVSLSSPIGAGNVATASVTTAPSANCSITVTYKSGPSKAKGLDPKTADTNGAVSWSWLVGGNTTPGNWPVDVTCSAGGQTVKQSTAITVT